MNVPGNPANTLGPISSPSPQQTQGPAESGAAKPAAFPSGNRAVATAAPTAHMQQAALAADSLPESTTLAERSVEDATDQTPGKLRQAASLVKQAAADKWQATKQAGRDKISSGIQMAKNPKETGRNAAAQGAQWAQGKYAAAKSKGAAAAAGLQQLKNNPRETMAAGGEKIKGSARAIKERACSVPGKVGKLMPTALKQKLPNVTALLSRQTASAQPSASLQPLVQKAAEQSQQVKETVELASQTIKEAKQESRNLENLCRLLDDPSPFYKTGRDVTVAWGGEQVQITGKGLARAKTVTSALTLAQNHQSAITEARTATNEQIAELRTGRADLKAAHKKDMQALRQSARAEEQGDFQDKLDRLKSTNHQIKGTISGLRKQLKTLVSLGRNQGKPVSDGYKRDLKNTSAQLQQLHQQAKAEQSQFNSQIKEIKQELSALRDASTGQPPEARQAQENQLVRQLAQTRETMASRAEELKGQSGALKAEAQTFKTALAEIRKKGINTPAYDKLKEQLKAARQELADNRQEISQLRAQHRADRKAISGMR